MAIEQAAGEWWCKLAVAQVSAIAVSSGLAAGPPKLRLQCCRLAESRAARLRRHDAATGCRRLRLQCSLLSRTRHLARSGSGDTHDDALLSLLFLSSILCPRDICSDGPLTKDWTFSEPYSSPS